MRKERQRSRARAWAAVLLAAFVACAAPLCRAADYVLLIDCTGTMRYQGKGSATLEAVEDFISSTRPGDFVTVYGYGEKPFAALSEYPAYVDTDGSQRAIAGAMDLSFSADRTDMTRGLELVWGEKELVFPRALEGAGRAGTSCVILLTDGKLIPCYDDYSKYGQVYARSRRRLLELGALFGDEGLPIYGVGLGRADKVDGELLAEVCARSGGAYMSAASGSELSGVFGRIADIVIGEPGRPSEGQVVTGQGAASKGKGTESQACLDRSSPRAAAARYFVDDLADTVYETVVGVLGVIVGFVAIGVQRRQSWTRAFTKPLLKKEIRVKGYFKPVYDNNIVGVRSCIPIENPGLPAVEVGESGSLGSDLTGVVVEMVGTPDGTPPTLKVMKGTVKVNGEVVEDERPLQDGDCVDFDGRTYTYLRGNRR